jgi:hypothetical protein
MHILHSMKVAYSLQKMGATLTAACGSLFCYRYLLDSSVIIVDVEGRTFTFGRVGECVWEAKDWRRKSKEQAGGYPAGS